MSAAMATAVSGLSLVLWSSPSAGAEGPAHVGAEWVGADDGVPALSLSPHPGTSADTGSYTTSTGAIAKGEFPLPLCQGSQFGASITTDSGTYSIGQTVNVTLRITNLGPTCNSEPGIDNADVLDGCVAVTASNASGQVVWNSFANPSVDAACAALGIGGPVRTGWTQSYAYSWSQDECPSFGVSCTQSQVSPGAYTIRFDPPLTQWNGVDVHPATVTIPIAPFIGMLSTADNGGYWSIEADGSVWPFGDAMTLGSLAGVRLNAPIVGIAPSPDREGYWLVGRDGGVFTFGDARFYGSGANIHMNSPAVGIIATPDGAGYWLVGADGGVFSYGSASFNGSIGSLRLNAPVVGGAATSSGHGYFLVAADGGLFAFGDARFKGSMATTRLNQPIVGLGIDPVTGGYWEVASDGGIFAFDAPFLGSASVIHLNGPVVGISGTTSGLGYRLVATDGGIFDFGDAQFYGSNT